MAYAFRTTSGTVWTVHNGTLTRNGVTPMSTTRGPAEPDTITDDGRYVNAFTILHDPKHVTIAPEPGRLAQFWVRRTTNDPRPSPICTGRVTDIIGCTPHGRTVALSVARFWEARPVAA